VVEVQGLGRIREKCFCNFNIEYTTHKKIIIFIAARSFAIIILSILKKLSICVGAKGPCSILSNEIELNIKKNFKYFFSTIDKNNSARIPLNKYLSYILVKNNQLPKLAMNIAPKKDLIFFCRIRLNATKFNTTVISNPQILAEIKK
jgi:hypothetical protein